MNLHRLDLNLLVALDALLAEQSVTKAANRVFLSQPAMSGALTRLREHFQDELVVRVGRSMVLTPFAASLAPRVREVLSDVNDVVRRRPAFDPATTDRVFTVVASEYVVSVFMPIVTKKLLALAPGVEINMPLRMSDFEQRMATGQIDAALTVAGLSLPNYPTARLFEDEYVCIAWKDNNEIGESITAEHFLQLRQAVRAMGRDNVHTLEQSWLHMLGWERKVAVRVPSFEGLPAVVVGTNLIAPMQRRLAEIAEKNFPIRILAHPANVPPFATVLQWPMFRDRELGNRWLRGIIMETAAEHFGPPPDASTVVRPT